MPYDTRIPAAGTMHDEPDIQYERRARFSNGDQGHAPVRDRSFVGLLRDLRDESINLVQDEVRLARTELQEKVNEARQGAISAVTGGAILGAGLFMILLAAAAGLYAAMWAMEVDPLISGWLAPLIVGVLVVIIGGALLAAGKKKMEPSNLRPERTERSLRETGAWAERKV
jgi:hypothetical protein